MRIRNLPQALPYQCIQVEVSYMVFHSSSYVLNINEDLYDAHNYTSKIIPIFNPQKRFSNDSFKYFHFCTKLSPQIYLFNPYYI